MSNYLSLPPSSAARRMQCPGSRKLESALPYVSNPAAEEGTVAHQVAADRFKNIIYTTDAQINNIPVSQDMIDGAELYYNNVMSRYDGITQLRVEEKLQLNAIHPAMRGIIDCWFYSNNILYIYDYKFGFGYVEVYENWQLIAYAAGVLSLLALQNIKVNAVILVIVQPRCYIGDPIRQWYIPIADIQQYIDSLKQSELKSLSEDAELVPGKECKYCRAKGVCPALKNEAAAIVESTYSQRPDTSTPASVGVELSILQDAKSLLDCRILGLEEIAKSMLMSGQQVANFELKNARGNQVWKADTEELKTISELIGINLKKPDDFITPKQAIKKGADAELINSLSEIIPGELKISRIDQNEIKKIFNSQVEE
jgi:hypothetical protein